MYLGNLQMSSSVDGSFRRMHGHLRRHQTKCEKEQPCGLQAQSSLMDREITAPSSAVPRERLALDDRPLLVIFDVETTGFGAASEIMQLAAISSTEQTLDRKILPRGNISSGSMKVTLLSVSERSGKCTLYYRQLAIEASDAQTVLGSFAEWLKNVSAGMLVVLVGHNCDRFDTAILLAHCKKYPRIMEISKSVAGFADTLPAFREAMPERYHGDIGVIS